MKSPSHPPPPKAQRMCPTCRKRGVPVWKMSAGKLQEFCRHCSARFKEDK